MSTTSMTDGDRRELMKLRDVMARSIFTPACKACEEVLDRKFEHATVSTFDASGKDVIGYKIKAQGRTLVIELNEKEIKATEEFRGQKRDLGTIDLDDELLPEVLREFVVGYCCETFGDFQEE